MNPNAHLFVYGSLMSRFQNPATAFLRANAVCFGGATMRGFLYEIDWYPGAVYDVAASSQVHGEIWQIKNEAALWPILDDYETVDTDQPGKESYDRRQVGVLHKNETFLAWVYLYNLPTAGLTRIESGRFRG